MKVFSLHDFIMKTLQGMATKYEYWQVMQYALNWYEKGVLVDADLEKIQSWFEEPEEETVEEE